MNNDKIEITYKTFKIQYSEFNEKWELLDDDNHHSYDNISLQAVKKYIDKLNKKKFDPIEAYYCPSYRYNYELVKITSIDEEGQYWITRAENSWPKRSKVSGDSLIKVTPENDELIKEIKKINAQETVLDEDKKKLFKKIESFEKVRN